MNAKKIIPIIIGILFALAIAFGLIQRNNSPELESLKASPQLTSQTTNGSFNDIFHTAESLKNQQEQGVLATTFIAGGDISLSRNIAYVIDQKKDPLIPFSGVANLLSSTDFNFANLETPFSNSDFYTPKNTLVFNAPKKNIEGLVKYNFKIVNLANNHAFDQGLIGLKTTRDWLDKNNIAHIGTGETLTEANTPKVVTSNGIRILFMGFSYSSINDGGKARNNYVARMEDFVEDVKSGSNPVSFWKKELGADYAVVTMHGGIEYTRQPDKLQTEFARSAIDAGADMVIGAHPHWVQTIEKYNGRYIFYSLGNFIFDQNWSKETSEGLLLKISLNKKPVSELQGNPVNAQLKEVELIPIIIENNSTPRPANEKERIEILKKIKMDTNKLYP